MKLAKTVTNKPIDVHCHNDLGLAVANSLAGAEAGANQIHVTIDGYGERVGIASLAEVTMVLKLLYGLERNFRYEMLSELSSLLSGYVNLPISNNRPIVGKNAYTHKAGTHLGAIIREPKAYELVTPRSVGNNRRIVFGELSGKNGAAFLLRTLGVEPTHDTSQRLAKGLKNLRRGDLFDLELSDNLETEAIKSEENLTATPMTPRE